MGVDEAAMAVEGGEDEEKRVKSECKDEDIVSRVWLKASQHFLL